MMGMVPPPLSALWRKKRKEDQPKEEHPMAEVWKMAKENREIIEAPDGTKCQLVFPMGVSGYVSSELTNTKFKTLSYKQSMVLIGQMLSGYDLEEDEITL